MEQLAKEVVAVLQDEAHGQLLGVGYYTEEEYEYVFLDEWAADRYDCEQHDRVLNELRLDAIRHGVYENTRDEELEATVKQYEHLIDVVVPVTGSSAIVFALQREFAGSIRDLIELVDWAVADSELQSPAQSRGSS